MIYIIKNYIFNNIYIYIYTVYTQNLYILKNFQFFKVYIIDQNFNFNVQFKMLCIYSTIDIII